MVNDYNGDSGHDENNDDDEVAVWSVGLRMQWVLATPYTVSRRAHNMNIEQHEQVDLGQLVLMIFLLIMMINPIHNMGAFG